MVLTRRRRCDKQGIGLLPLLQQGGEHSRDDIQRQTSTLAGCTRKEILIKRGKQFAPRKFKIAGQSIGNRVGRASKVVVSRDILVEVLVDSKQMEQMSRELFSSSAAFLLPNQDIEVVCFAEEGHALTTSMRLFVS